MKTRKLILQKMATILFSVIALYAFSQKNPGPDLSQFKSNGKIEEGNFFVKQKGIDNQAEKVTIYNNISGMEAMADERIGASVKYIEHLVEDVISPFAQTTVKNNSGKNYLHWVVSHDEKNGIFVVERSENGVDFVSVGFKNRIGTSIHKLSYYFTDTDFSEGTIFYRILAIGEDGSFKYSDTIMVENLKSSSQVDYDVEKGVN